jgi:predicted O-methyltransferase YrrM
MGHRLKLKKTGIIRIYFLVFLFAFCCIPYQVFANADIEQELREYAEHSKKYSFSTDWVSHDIPVWKNILGQFMNKPNIHYLEIGVYEGRSLIWMLENVLTHSTAKATCIDVFDWGDLEKTFRHNLKISGFSRKVKIIKGLSQIELRRLPLHSFDIIYIDGSHTSADVISDAVLSWPLLKKDGLLIFDDYLWQDYLPMELRPQLAIDSFINAYRYFVEIVHQGCQVILKKINTTFSTENFYDSSLIGQYVYSWDEKRLFRLGTNEPVELSDTEKELLEKLIKSKKFGEAGFVYDTSILNNEAFVNLRKRLNLNLGESKEQ